jgi:hypothetical protein
VRRCSARGRALAFSRHTRAQVSTVQVSVTGSGSGVQGQYQYQIQRQYQYQIPIKPSRPQPPAPSPSQAQRCPCPDPKSSVAHMPHDCLVLVPSAPRQCSVLRPRVWSAAPLRLAVRLHKHKHKRATRPLSSAIRCMQYAERDGVSVSKRARAMTTIARRTPLARTESSTAHSNDTNVAHRWQMPKQMAHSTRAHQNPSLSLDGTATTLINASHRC